MAPQEFRKFSQNKNTILHKPKCKLKFNSPYVEYEKYNRCTRIENKYIYFIHKIHLGEIRVSNVFNVMIPHIAISNCSHCNYSPPKCVRNRFEE